ncbi:class I SAM-dependent methyltransferase [Mycobacterium deserti]|uniref:Class I SAM-dependent methyltransferase n=1 Tax=Mycobacterium deserti TaxID=2978347 RepID=A0ABT2MKG6_9MYCO|nr:class I SAM-dependent methyltransferase [Mycobacterium deserti]MCT7661590.1 class I SAM-dependent methyltransferase [Mycobacterium deserti]
MTSDPEVAADQAQRVQAALARRLYLRSVAAGKISLPAVPGLLDEYVAMCGKLFAAVGREFSAEEMAQVRSVLAGQLAEAYAASPRSNIVISYEAPIGPVLNYHVNAEWFTVEGAYENWISTRKPPLFGSEPDARVWALAGETPDPATLRVLDIGAGTGRNALALARRGHPVDVVEMTPQFAEQIRAESERDGLGVRVIQRDVFTALADLRTDYGLILLSEVVSDFRDTRQLRGVFELATRCLEAGGRLVFNIFLARDGYLPDDAARELGQQTYTSIFTREELGAAASGLPLTLVSDDSVYAYEQAHLPAGAWPPTSWYADWVRGLDVFTIEPERCPIDMRWVVYQKPV